MTENRCTLTNFPWPKLPDRVGEPTWDGANFWVDGASQRILSYGSSDSNWSHELTEMHEAEAGSDHPIDVASRNLALQSMQSLSGTTPVVIDVGCSSGFVLDVLQKKVPQAFLIGADYLLGPLNSLAKRMPTVPILQFDLRICPLPSESIDGVTALNVLEHIDQDEKALREIHRILKPGSLAHIEVPAGPGLYDIYDELLMHYRRYRLGDLVKMARKVGFEVEKATHLGFIVYPMFFLAKKIGRTRMKLSPKAKEEIVAQQIRSTRVNPLFDFLIRFEVWISKYFAFPFGIRCVVVLRKSA